MTTTNATAPSNRVPWVDTGRGIAILLVPLYHATNWLLGVGLNIDYWHDINDVLASLRMPLFFALSGLFAPKWLLVNWRTLFRSKILLFAWVFLVWELIGTVVFMLGQVTTGKGVNVLGSIEALLISPVLPRFELWFIWALMLFFIVAKATRRIDPRIQLVAVGVMSLVALTIWPTVTTGWTGSAKYYFFFLAGIYLRNQLLRFGAVRSHTLLAGVIALWAVLSITFAVLDIRGVPGLYFVNCVAGVFGGIALSRVLGRVNLLSRIGKQTLPIYLAHTPIIIVLSFVLSLPVIFPWVNAIAPVVPLLVAPLAIYLALALYHLCRTRDVMFLYEPPAKLGKVVDRIGRRQRNEHDPARD